MAAQYSVTAAQSGRHHQWTLTWSRLQRAQNSALVIATGCRKMADVAELHLNYRELPVRHQNELISQQFAISFHLPKHPCLQLCHKPLDDRPEWRQSLFGLTSSNTSPMCHSGTPATSRQSAASTMMRSKLSLIAAHQNY